MSLKSDDSVMRNLAQYHYLRNRYLGTCHDADDLFQDAWIQFNNGDGESIAAAGVDEQTKIRRAVHRATDRAFGRLRKRLHRGSPSETALEFDPADCQPDADVVIDLRNQIQSLPLDERLVIELLRRGYEGNEIAGMLKMSPQAVTRRKQKAIEKLRHKLDAHV